MSKELKETMLEGMKAMGHQIEIISKETGIIIKNQMKILELKSTKVKNVLKRLSSRFELEEKRVANLKLDQ